MNVNEGINEGKLRHMKVYEDIQRNTKEDKTEGYEGK